MNLVLITGLSGSGKSVALRYLEDEGYYCVDNLPANLLEPLIAASNEGGQTRLAISIDARSATDFEKLHDHIVAMRAQGREVHSVFLTANDDTLIQRFSETRRRHPLSREANADADTSLKDSIALERTRLTPLISVLTRAMPLASAIRLGRSPPWCASEPYLPWAEPEGLK